MARITPENARILAARSAEVRRQRKLERIQAHRHFSASPLNCNQDAEQDVENEDEEISRVRLDTAYRRQKLAIVREQIGKADMLFGKEDDPQRLDRLASALSKLYEVEQKLAGRPNPGTAKPVEPPKKQRERGEPCGPVFPDGTPIPDPEPMREPEKNSERHVIWTTGTAATQPKPLQTMPSTPVR